ncbi:11965_t:CDS:2 [Ambispora gerdemannii]|uniref:11965_t:CDS:1 n=1 Tax=Ambispora gerdemannii TaxID=144530 RepID=A0A9N9CC65_9GLOM|nr:11965_t:CDS:2 [Ambispora gerdemannii]
MSCYLWFSDINTDQYQSSSSPLTPGGNSSSTIVSSTSSLRPRFSDFRPRDAFKKFCRDVVTATQVSHSVILLSLLYISRMKSNNPAIQGHPGSEYRTFTVALMLANKFLDDNTYTNKTWSEVTNISVREINIMEIEFLGSLNFSLYVSEDQYFDWLQIMDQFVLESEMSLRNSNRDRLTQADCGIAINSSSFGGVNSNINAGVQNNSLATTKLLLQAHLQQQQQYQLEILDQMQNLSAARKLHLQSNFLNARSPAGFAQINSMPFPTTVV